MNPKTLVAENLCPQCGATLAPGRAPGTCPRCLMRTALGDDGPGPAEPAPRPATGALRLGNYELCGELARGGMGVVYKARQAGLNRFVAVKVVAAGEFAGREFRERFRVEAEAAARLSHPNIVAIYEVGEAEGRQFFSMELVEGPNLAQWRQDRSPAPDAVAALIRTIAEAIHFAHQRGVLHRDLKPQNILMDGDGRARITDFGLAKQVADTRDLTVTGAGFGSPGYSAPEQISGRRDRVGPASDVYSLGAILYFLLTGVPPHASPVALETFRMALQEPPVPPCRVQPSVPRDLETICLKCLEKEPARRYPSARALAEDLEHFQKREPLLARRPGPFWRMWSVARARPWAITGLASLFQLAMIGLAYGLWQQTHFLQWRLDHVGAAPPFGLLPVFSPSVACVLIYACVLVGYLPLKDLRVRLAEGRAFERGDVLKYVAIGACFALAGVWLLLENIQGFVWRHEHQWHRRWLALLPSLSLFWFGSIIALKAVRGHYAGERSADVLAAQRGSPIGASPTRFLLAMFAPLGLLVPAAWLWQGPDQAPAFAYLLANVFLVVLGLRFWSAMRDEMRSFWQFLVLSMAALSVEIAPGLARPPQLAALAIGVIVGSLVIRRANIIIRK